MPDPKTIAARKREHELHGTTWHTILVELDRETREALEARWGVKWRPGSGAFGTVLAASLRPAIERHLEEETMG